ncbi:4'-phosphopantetheinyl transferase superfamily protein [Mycoplasma phocoenae]|uniref:4'-phosphopantetheinyl transferase superfamily protein n=1 Tax=Mycoplasma phocoenae TaxID=754517 RepID=A0A858U1I9_9MOLU|nr:4'-phosphopantetheinyl transferase superfamily protein [Mycoplasma phocoenae]QJG66984.1 4'-phosphopantetheinyl transferase superfamily protein [Mycoplasma phocoenae]
MIKHGIDIALVKRFKKINRKTIERFLSPNEAEIFKKLRNEKFLKENTKTLFLATRWAIKEALFKADNQNYKYSEIDIKKINDVYTYENYSISVSHDGEYVIASAIKIKE